MSRPLGVALIALLFAFSGAFVLVMTVANLDTAMPPGLIPAFVLGNVLAPVASICAAYGLWKRLSWGWRLGASLAALNVFSILAQLVWIGSHSVMHVLPLLWKLIIPLVMLGYLLSAFLIEAFGWGPAEVKARRAEVLLAGLLAAVVFLSALRAAIPASPGL